MRLFLSVQSRIPSKMSPLSLTLTTIWSSDESMISTANFKKFDKDEDTEFVGEDGLGNTLCWSSPSQHATSLSTLITSFPSEVGTGSCLSNAPSSSSPSINEWHLLFCVDGDGGESLFFGVVECCSCCWFLFDESCCWLCCW